MKKYTFIYVLSIVMFISLCGFMVFVSNYYYSFSHFGEDIMRYTEWQNPELSVTVKYNGRNYYLNGGEMADVTYTLLRGSLTNRMRKYFKDGSDYEGMPKIEVVYDKVDIVVYDIGDEDDDRCFMVYKKANGRTEYFEVRKLAMFEHLVDGLRLIN